MSRSRISRLNRTSEEAVAICAAGGWLSFQNGLEHDRFPGLGQARFPPPFSDLENGSTIRSNGHGVYSLLNFLLGESVIITTLVEKTVDMGGLQAEHGLVFLIRAGVRESMKSYERDLKAIVDRNSRGC
jgi:hypothetical protein